MDYIGATLQSNPIMGLLAERLKQAQQFATRPFGYQNPPAEMLLNLLGVPAVQQTAERLAYGEPLTTGRGMTTQIRPEVAEAALTVAPVAGLLGRGAEKAAMAAGRAGERYAERVVPQIMEKGGMPAQLLQDLSQGSIRPMDVYHGTPYRFDKFDASKIGTGEGAQAYSYGLYFAESPDVAKSYANAISDGVAARTFAPRSNAIQNSIDYFQAMLRGEVPRDIKNGIVVSDEYINSQISQLNNQLPAVYKVDLPDEAIANMLDWDKPVSKQPNVMKALRSEAEQRVRDRKIVDIENDIRASLPSSDIGDNYLSMFNDANVGINQDIQKQALEKLNKMDLKPLVDKELDSMKPADMNWNMTGKEFYELLSKREGSPEKASGLLQRQGVPGTRYLDQQSRTPGGSDTSNFVVFPGGEDLLTIKEINDKPIGGLLGQSKAAFDVTRKDASELFGAGAQRVMYQDPKSGGAMEVLVKPDGTASVLSLEVPETSRGKGIGQSLQAQVMQDYPEMMGQVSSKAAAKTAYRLGRRPPFKPDATLEDVYKMMDEDSSVNMVSPEMQKRFRQSLLD